MSLHEHSRLPVEEVVDAGADDASLVELSSVPENNCDVVSVITLVSA
jgi:hypothetical protein